MAIDIVQEIKLRTDLVELISQYVPLRKSGRTHKGLCPFHGEKTPSFVVDGERGFYKCYGCGQGGDCFKFLQTKENLSFTEAGELLARRLGLEWVRRGDTAEKRSQRERLYDVVALAERYFRRSLESTPEVRDYLARRGLAAATVEQFRLGYAPPGYEALLTWLKREQVSLEDAEGADLVLQSEGNRLRDRFVDRVIFPIFDLEGRPIAFGGRTLRPDGIPKYLNSRETPIFQKGRSLYGLHVAKQAIPQAQFAVAVEGYMDLIALHQAGIANSIASLGTAITETHVGILSRYSRELVVCYDGDGAGMRAAERNSAMFEAAGCNVRVASLPEGKDPDTFIAEEGADAFRALLNRAAPLLDYQLDKLRRESDLGDQGARLAFVREAAKIISRSGSALTRQEYSGRLTAMIGRLAEEWYPGDPHRAMQARVALAQEVERLLRRDRMSPRPTAGPPVPAVPAAGPASSRALAEEYLLRAALTEDRWAEQVAGRLTAEHFAEPRLLRIAERLLGNNESESVPLAERSEAIQQDPELAEAVSQFLLQPTPISDEGLQDSILKVERAWKQDRKQELMRAREAGELGPDDPRLQELNQLVRELGGNRRYEQ